MATYSPTNESYAKDQQEDIQTPFGDLDGEQYQQAPNTNQNYPQPQPQQQVPPPSAPQNNNNFAPPAANTFAKLSDTARVGFIRKVYGILATQLLSTIAIVTAGWKIPALFDFLVGNQTVALSIIITCFVAYLVCFCTLACSRKMSRTVPTNYILLAILTLAESILL